MLFVNHWLKSFLVFFPLLLVYLYDSQTMIKGPDIDSNILMPVNILKHGDLTLSPQNFPSLFTWEIQEAQAWRAISSDALKHQSPQTLSEHIRDQRLRYIGHSYNVVDTKIEGQFANTFGFGVGLAGLPIFALLRLYDAKLLDQTKALWHTGKITAAIYIALSAVILMLILIGFCSFPTAYLVSISYGLGSGVYSTSSQALWQQTPNIFFLTLGSYFFLQNRRSYSKFFCGMALGMACLCRPTSLLAALMIWIWIMWKKREDLVQLSLGLFPFLVTQTIYNLYVFHQLFNFGQTNTGVAIALSKTGVAQVWQWDLIHSVPALLFSPSRGLLFLSPIFIFAIWGLVLIFKNEKWQAMRVLLVLPLCFFLIQASWFDWWGGWCYGYRPLLETTPFISLMLAPALESTRNWSQKTLYALCLLWSISVQFVGASSDRGSWNHFGCNIDHPSCRDKVWSLTNNQFFYQVQHYTQERQAKILDLNTQLQE